MSENRDAGDAMNMAADSAVQGVNPAEQMPGTEQAVDSAVQAVNGAEQGTDSAVQAVNPAEQTPGTEQAVDSAVQAVNGAEQGTDFAVQAVNPAEQTPGTEQAVDSAVQAVNPAEQTSGTAQAAPKVSFKKRLPGYIEVLAALFLAGMGIWMYYNTLGTRLLFVDVAFGRICKYYWIAFIGAAVFLAVGSYTLKRLRKEVKKNGKLE